MPTEALMQFVESWGAMGVLWGINRSMARVHALLIVSGDPVGLDEIAAALRISRGNASMCLKELRNWGVIRKVLVSGDRKDYYVVESDVWHMFFRIATERKKREFDPALEALRQVRASDEAAAEPVRARLAEMEQLLATVDRIGAKFLEGEDASKTLLQFLTRQLLPDATRP